MCLIIIRKKSVKQGSVAKDYIEKKSPVANYKPYNAEKQCNCNRIILLLRDVARHKHRQHIQKGNIIFRLLSKSRYSQAIEYFLRRMPACEYWCWFAYNAFGYFPAVWNSGTAHDKRMSK